MEDTTKFLDTDYDPKKDQEAQVQAVSPVVEKKKSILSDEVQSTPEEQKQMVETSSKDVGRVTHLENDYKGLRADVNRITASITKMMFVVIFLTVALLGSKISFIDLNILANGEIMKFSGTLIEVIIQLIIALLGMKVTYAYTQNYDERQDGTKVMKPNKIQEIQDTFSNITEFKQTQKR